MSVPNATRQQIDAMNKIAAEKYGVQDGDTVDQVPAMHPILSAHNEEIVQEDVEDQEESVENDSQDGQDQESQVDETAYAAPVKSSNQQNIKNLRERAERAERAERERDEALKYIMSMQQQQKPHQQAPAEEDPFANLGIDDESLVEGKHLKELVKEIKNLRSTVKNYEQKSYKTDQQTLEVRLQTQFPDFNQVVTHENLVQLRSMNPDLADSILKNEDQYKQAKLAYDMVKQMGIYRGQEYETEKVMVQRNISKPRPIASLSPTKSESPMSKVNSFANAPLTKELKDQHYQEMLQAMKGL